MRPKSLKKTIKLNKNSSAPTQRYKRPQQSLLQQWCSFSLWTHQHPCERQVTVRAELSKHCLNEETEKQSRNPSLHPQEDLKCYLEGIGVNMLSQQHTPITQQTCIPQAGVSSESDPAGGSSHSEKHKPIDTGLGTLQGSLGQIR